MSDERDIDLINDLIDRPAETSWIEFKKNNTDPKMIGTRCSALSNAARIDGKNCAYMLWGVDDDTHTVVGTDFDPNTEQVGNQDFHLWLAQRLKPSIAFSFRAVQHPQGQVIILEVPAATSAPVAFDDVAYIRILSFPRSSVGMHTKTLCVHNVLS